MESQSDLGLGVTECHCEWKDANGVQLIDVRTPGEYQKMHVEEACNMPLGRLDPDDVAEACGGDKNARLLMMCTAGVRAQKAGELLLDAGFTNVRVVSGGIDAWKDAGKPVVHGKEGMSLERQVRIAAGSIIVLGVLLAYLANPHFALLAGFVGCGLVFAGITNFCGMGLLLLKMPWNR